MTDAQEAPDGTTVAGVLPPAQFRLAVAQAVRDRLPLSHVLSCLWRTDPAEMSAAYDDAIFGRVEVPDAAVAGRHGLRAERMRELRRPLPMRRKRGLTITEIAAQAGVERETLACLLEHHGYLELVPFGGTQRRRMVTDQAFTAGLGHNVDASRIRIAAVEGSNRAGVFPVFYPEHVSAILWTLDHAGISATAAAIKGKRGRLRWLLDIRAVNACSSPPLSALPMPAVTWAWAPEIAPTSIGAAAAPRTTWRRVGCAPWVSSVVRSARSLPSIYVSNPGSPPSRLVGKSGPAGS